MNTADRPNGGLEFDHTIKLDSDQLVLLGLCVDALAAGAGDRGASDRMGDFYKEMARDGTQQDIVAKCQTLYEVIVAALDSTIAPPGEGEAGRTPPSA